MPVKKINVSELSTNQVLARAVVNSNGNILMYEGARIRKENIQKLIKIISVKFSLKTTC